MGASYDQSADAVVDNTRTLADTLGHFGSLVSWAGYDHELANYNSNISTAKGAPPTAPPPVPATWGGRLLGRLPTAFGGSGNGLQTDIPNLLEDIGIPVPDGDTALLDNAAAAWHAFITCEAVEDAMNLSLLGVFRFQHVDSPEVPDIQDRLGTLASCAINIQDTGNRLRQACSDHSSGLTQLRDTLHDLLARPRYPTRSHPGRHHLYLLPVRRSPALPEAPQQRPKSPPQRHVWPVPSATSTSSNASPKRSPTSRPSLAKTKNLITAIRDLKKTSAVEEDSVPAEEAAANDNLPGTQEPNVQTSKDYAHQQQQMDHVFVPKHNLDNFVSSSGGEDAADDKIIDSVQGVPDGIYGKTNPLVRTIDGQTITIRGAVINGVFKISTAFIPLNGGLHVALVPVTPRPLSNREISALSSLLSVDFDGVEQLRAQLSDLRVVATWGEGSPSVDLEPSPRMSQVRGRAELPVVGGSRCRRRLCLGELTLMLERTSLCDRIRR